MHTSSIPTHQCCSSYKVSILPNQSVHHLSGLHSSMLLRGVRTYFSPYKGSTASCQIHLADRAAAPLLTTFCSQSCQLPCRFIPTSAWPAFARAPLWRYGSYGARLNLFMLPKCVLMHNHGATAVRNPSL